MQSMLEDASKGMELSNCSFLAMSVALFYRSGGETSQISTGSHGSEVIESS